jgi:hypothetical protein
MQRTLVPVVCLALAACSPGDAGPAGSPESKTYDLKDFTAVSAETGIDLRISQGPFAVSAKSENADLSRLKIERRGDKLEIGTSGRFTLGKSPTYIVTVSAPAWKAISATAGVKVTADGLQVEDLAVEISAGVAAHLSGSCKSLTASASAGAALDAAELKCTKVTIETAAGASADVYASEQVTASAAAGAKVNVHGHPPTVNKDASFAGVIEMAN